MNKQDLVDFVAEKTGFSKKDATQAVEAFFEGIVSGFKKGQEVKLVGFGTFLVQTRKARQGRNPRTGETIHIAASHAPTFRAGKELKEAVNS